MDVVVPSERVRVLHRRQVGCKREWTTVKRASMSVSCGDVGGRSSNATVDGRPSEEMVFLWQLITREQAEIA
jgi:hypothetical protein